jgi:hypothetical protein
MSRKQNSVPLAELDLEKILNIDSEILSYGKYISGRILGSQLTLKNLSTKARSFTIQINSDSFKTSPYEMLRNFYLQDLPFGLKPDSVFKNMYKYW